MRLLITITLFFSCFTLLIGCKFDGTDDLDRTGTLWAPYLEWELENSSWEGNPFDVEANVTFTHFSSEEQWTASMFYDGDESWKFRFTALKTGRWTFRTSSEDTDLDGKHGAVNVNTNSDPDVRGFIVGHSNKYAWQVGENGEVDVFVPNIYMNMKKFGNPERCGWTAVKPTFSEPQTFAAYLDEAEEHGSNGVFAQMGNQWFKVQVPSWSEHVSENPDLTTFRAIEQAIAQAHRRALFCLDDVSAIFVTESGIWTEPDKLFGSLHLPVVLPQFGGTILPRVPAQYSTRVNIQIRNS